MIRVLVVDDSPSFRAALTAALSSDPGIDVVGQAGDGEEALALLDALAPDVMTLDAVMPRLDGIEVARRVLARHPLPIILMTALASTEEQRAALNALKLGVVDVANKPALAGPRGARGIAEVVRLVKTAAEIVIRPPRPHPAAPRLAGARAQPTLVAIAASTGGPAALERLLTQLPARFPPLLVAQHLAPSFAKGHAAWLAGATGRRVLLVAEARPLTPNAVYLAADGHHLRVTRGVVVGLPAGAGELTANGNVLLQPVAAVHAGEDGILGVVLTGMGDDGATGLAAMRAAGAWTVAQDRESSIVYGMPRAAAEAGACCEVLSLDDIAARIAGNSAAITRVTG